MSNKTPIVFEFPNNKLEEIDKLMNNQEKDTYYPLSMPVLEVVKSKKLKKLSKKLSEKHQEFNQSIENSINDGIVD